MKLTPMTTRGSTFWPNRPPSGRQGPPAPSPTGRTTGCHRPGAKLAICLLVFLALGGLSVLRAQTNGLAEAIEQARVFDRAIVPVGTQPPADAETAALAAAVGVIQPHDFNTTLGGLEGFVETYPNSPWAASVESNLGKYYYEQGRYSLALKHWESAWSATGQSTDPAGKWVADYTLALWTRLLASLGRLETLVPVFQAEQWRVLDHGPLQQVFLDTKEALQVMLHQPGTSYRCGTFALYNMGRAAQGDNFAKGLIVGVPSPDTGFSLASLVDLAGRAGLAVTPVQRVSGNQLIVPSVVHWAVNHYAAIVAQDGDNYKVVDPTFGEPRWLKGEAINAEASGYFLVPASLVQPGWRVLAAGETASIYGRGYVTAITDNRDKDCPPVTKPTRNKGSGAPAPAAYPGGPTGLPSVSAQNKSPNDLNGCPTCGAQNGRGLTVWSVSEPYISLWMEDQPLSYTPSRGIPVAFHLTYHQRDQVSQDSDVFNVGNLWGMEWRTYVHVAGGTTVTLHCPGADTRTYVADGATMEYTTQTRLQEFLDGNGNVTRFELYFPDGRTNVYGFFVHDSVNYQNYARLFLTQMLDTAGQGLTLNYTTNSTGIFLSSITDADGHTTSLSYGNSSYPLQVTSVTDPFSRSCTLQYDSSGTLTNITDTASLSSGFIYDNNGWITNLTTPYGTTTFTITGANTEDFGSDPTNTFNRSILVTEPTGSHQLYAYRMQSSTLWGSSSTSLIPASYSDTGNVPSSSPVGELDNGGGNEDFDNGAMYNRNSFYWNRQQYAALSTTTFSNFTTNDYNKARMRHWLLDSGGLNVGETVSVEWAPCGDGSTVGQMTWYDYYGKSFADWEGTNSAPDTVIQVQPSGNTWYVLYARNVYGLVTSATSRYTQANGSIGSRTWNYSYDSGNNIDLIQVTGPNSEVLAGFSYNSLHVVLVETNAVGDVTTSTYDSDGRLVTRQYATGLTRTNSYGTDGYLSQVNDSGTGASQSYTWQNGLLHTYTDVRGLQVTLTWDNLLRLTGLSFPDGTTISNRYTDLDLTSTKDRLGNWTSYTYNGVRQLTSVTDANSHTTDFGYCDCGALDAITNALSQVTSFSYDLNGLRTNVVFADGTSRSFGYNRLGQLTSVTDNLGSRTYSYNLQGLLTNVANASGTESAAVFDNEDRATTVTDANGVSVTQTFDYLGRVLSRTYPDSGVEYYQYGPSGVTRYTNQLGKVWQFAYDAGGRQTNEVTPNIETISSGWSAAGDRTSLTDGLSHTTSWGYSLEGLLTNKTVQGGTVVLTNQFDANHELTLRWTPAGGSQNFYYDALGNNTRRTNPAVTNQFDALNRLTNMVDAVGTTAWTFTSAGDVASEIGPWSNSTVTSTYDGSTPHLRVGLSLQQPSGSWTNGFSYDSADRLRTVTSVAGTFTYTYNGPGNVWTNLAQPPGSRIGKSLDSVARLTLTELVNSGGTTLNSHGYTYNTGNQRTQQSWASGAYVNYGYESDGQLQSAVGGGGDTTSLGYKYDAGWNLNTRTNSGATTAFTVNGVNELTGGPTSPYGWDNNGNETTNVNYGCTWDGNDQLTSITSGTTYQTLFTYDGLGRLRTRQENTYFGGWQESSITHYLYDGMRVIQERNINNTPTVSYTRGSDLSGGLPGAGLPRHSGATAGGIGGLLARSSGYSNGTWSTHYFYHADGNGNVTYLMDSSQSMAATYKYDPFGNLLSSSGTMAGANVYRFSSKEQHANSGLYYYGFRFYDPNLQRWLNRDPVQEERALNLYTFTENNPIDKVDPFGHSSIPATVVAAIGSGDIAQMQALLDLAGDLGLSEAAEAALRAAIANAAKAAALAAAAAGVCEMARHEAGQRNYINDEAALIAKKTGDPICTVLRAMMAAAKRDNSRAGKALQQTIKQAMKAANCTHHN